MTHTLLTERRAVVRLSCSLMLLALVLAPMGCKKKKVRIGATDEETPKMQSVLNMGDPKVEPQLVKGFHGVEAAAWRWTEKQFTVALRPPFGASQKGAKLSVKLTIPPVTIEKLKTDSNLLSSILTYHVVPGQASPAQVTGMHKTVQGGEVNVTGMGTSLKVNNAGVVCGGVRTANATVYLIDTVLMPPAA